MGQVTPVPHLAPGYAWTSAGMAVISVMSEITGPSYLEAGQRFFSCWQYSIRQSDLHRCPDSRGGGIDYLYWWRNVKVSWQSGVLAIMGTFCSQVLRFPRDWYLEGRGVLGGRCCCCCCLLFIYFKGQHFLLKV